MRIFIRFIALFLSLIALQGDLFGQSTKYLLKVRGGAFIPEANASRYKSDADYITRTAFGTQHYVVLQFEDLPPYEKRESLQRKGIKLLEYIPELAYTASIDKSITSVDLVEAGIRSIIYLKPTNKTVPALLQGLAPAHATKQPGWADLVMVTYEKLTRSDIQSTLAAQGILILNDYPLYKQFILRVPISNMSRLVDMPFAQWVEFIDPPNELENLPGRTLHRVNVLNDGVRNLKGDGINIGIWDGGEVSPHLDFSPDSRRMILEPGGLSSDIAHATHCAGTIAGRGLINPTARGMAPNAKLYSYNFNVGSTLNELAVAISTLGLNVSSHSYGASATCGLSGSGVAYSPASQATDLNLNNHPHHLHVHSAGNSQGACTGGWTTITGSGKSAKNNIVVANITSTETLNSGSSCGPVFDGRIKPDISAMGTSVFSTFHPLNTYATATGTSIATPGVAGTVALLVERFKQLNSNQLPPSSLIKNTVLNTARDLGNVGPDYRFGYGRINALQAVSLLEGNRYRVSTISTGFTNDEVINIPPGATRLKVMLTWNDPAASTTATIALVNNLDLKVINGSNTFLPWILDPNNPDNPATTGIDNISNIEQVSIENPVAGSYTLRVQGTAVPSGVNQTYSLTWTIESPSIVVTYPNGNESLNPGSTEVITWDNTGVNGAQSVEYSLDGGSNWVSLAASLPASTQRLSWTIPAANTSNALVRVSAGGITDVSDAPFRILGRVTGFAGNNSSCSAGEVSLNWTGVANATHYDILVLNTVTAEFEVLAPNVSGTSYNVTGLTPNASYWFSILAKNNTTIAISERANAINVIASAGGGALGVPGNISGLQTICGEQNNLTYSIAPIIGAVTYTWTVPAGAAIMSGQGTPSIVVNFATGASSGNITVVASNGICNASPVTLAISIGSNAVAAPTSGGNQSQVVCPGTALPTLTATANVQTGNTIRWYDAASGGNIVNNPSLSTAGTVTYYAASVSNLTGCESSTRTAVTLTLTAVSNAAITPSGPTTLCQGSSVTLAANNGSSYTWSNGATTSSIVVTSSGTFSVTISNNGCISTSAPVTVTVNPNPTATVTASGPLSFCAGSSVTLSAPSGNNYSWSNGASTQTVTIGTSGSYTVTVTNSFGCAVTSAATNIAVSPNPVVTLTAFPYQNLYPGLTTNLNAQVTPAGNYTYTWFRNGTLINGATGNSLSNITPNQLGQYSVRVQNQTGLPCSNLSNSVTIGDSATNRLFILPNPSKGQFEVAYFAAGTEQYTLSIYDARGALAFRKSYAITGAYQRMAVDMRHQATGIYQVVLTNRAGKPLANGKVLIR